nr:peptidase MA family metallohydrolase [Pelagicoccus albus]
MTPQEAEVYGPRAIKLLEKAHTELSQSYGIELPVKTTVEIYPNPADFETRTFGMPGTPGFLGVCFGPVFTINSPASRSANWEAVLYHEFCHTITLTMSQNRMPRWLSEGISVYEEQLFNPAWGQRMSADYRDRILSEQMQPVSSMSSAFLRAEDGQDIQFAYFQSYLVVDFLVQNYGKPALRELLQDLGKGEETNAAIAKRFAPLPELDLAFAEFAKAEASKLAGEFRFQTQQSPLATAIQITGPKTDYSSALQEGWRLLEEEDWENAAERLQDLIEKAGYLTGSENAHWPLAVAYRKLGERESEIATLEAITRHEGSQLKPLVRLLELSQEEQDAAASLKWANQWIAINPMAETPWRALLEAASDIEQDNYSAEAARSLIALDPPDSPALHYQLAEILQDSDPTQAKRHVLMALQDAPRFQKAYHLLNELQAAAPAPPEPSDNRPKIDALDIDIDFLQ